VEEILQSFLQSPCVGESCGVQVQVRVEIHGIMKGRGRKRKFKVNAVFVRLKFRCCCCAVFAEKSGTLQYIACTEY